MDVYHKVLVKLFEETGGSDSKAVDFADLIKKLGFHANYNPIFKELSVQGWIVETSKVDWVKITHWGIMEAKKSLSGEGGDADELQKDSNRLLAEARELVALLDFLTPSRKPATPAAPGGPSCLATRSTTIRATRALEPKAPSTRG
jgi:phage anti-repressor protein